MQQQTSTDRLPKTSTQLVTASEYSHLSDSAKEAIDLPRDQRIHRIRSSRWIGYPRAKQILDKLEDLLTYPKRHRMPNLLIVGDTNNGKTMIVNRFHQLHLPFDRPNGEGLELPVLYVQVPPTPDESRFYEAILDKLFAPYRGGDKVGKKQGQAIRILTRLNIRLLILDEIHHILVGTQSKQREFLNTIKYLANELQIPLVAAGIKDAHNAILTDPQLSNRFAPVFLPRWEMGNEFLRLLATFEQMLPLKRPSNLIEKNIALKILNMSEGTIGEISTLLTEAAVHAVRSGDEQITGKVLNSIRWVQPSDRKWKHK